ncbi:MAG: RNA polymerase sigma factor [Woeseiaceae bacterium]
MSTSQPTTRSARPDTEERELLKSIAARDRDALTELYGRYHAKLFKFVFRLTRSYASADELVNDIMLAVWRSAAKFRGESKPSTWIFGIAYRQTLKRLSRKHLTVAANFDVDQLPDRQPQTVEQEDWVRQGLDTLPATQRLAVELVFFLGLSYEEVAAVTECPVNTVKTRMFHARRKLKAQLTSSASGADTLGESE